MINKVQRGPVVMIHRRKMQQKFGLKFQASNVTLKTNLTAMHDF